MKSISDIRIQLRDRFVRFYTDDLVKISRKRRANQVFPRKAPYSQPLTQAQKDEIIAFWKPYRDIEKEIKWFAFYNASCQDKSKLKYYIPDGVYFTDFDFPFTSPRRSDDLDDKNLYDLYFHDVKMPKTVIRLINGEYLDKDYHIIPEAHAMQLCADAGQVVCKEARLAFGGHSVRFFDFSKSTIEDFKSWLTNTHCDNINVQEVIHQHESFVRLHPNSVNSLRIMSLMLDGEVHILSSIVRMGRDGAAVDNASEGGIMCGVSGDGQLGEFAYDENGNRWSQHPQGAVFKESKVVGHEKCCELIKALAGRMYTTSGIVSWDFAVDADGEPILIEVNLTYGGVVIHQLCNGPIFGDMTEVMLERIYHRKS